MTNSDTKGKSRNYWIKFVLFFVGLSVMGFCLGECMHYASTGTFQ